MAAEQMTWQRDWAVTPGEILLEAIQDRGMSQSDLARRMGRPIKTINEIVNGKAAITPDTAIQLEMTLGIEAAFWNNLESAYRAHLARSAGGSRPRRARLVGGDLPAQGPRQAQADQPRRQGVRRRSPSCSRSSAWARAMRGIAIGCAPAVAYRASPAFEASPLATAAWLRWGEIIAGAHRDRSRSTPSDSVRVLAEIRDDDPPRLSPDPRQGPGALRERRCCAGAHARVHGDPPERCGALAQPPTRRSSSSASGTRPTTISGSASSTRLAHLLGRKRVDHVDGVAQYVEVGDEEEEADRFSRDTLIPRRRTTPSSATAVQRRHDQGVRQGAERRRRDRGRAPSARKARRPIPFQQPQEARQHQRIKLSCRHALLGTPPR